MRRAQQIPRRLQAIALACSISVGALAQTVTVTSYTNDANRPGLDIAANYDLGANWKDDCCPKDNIRWLQYVKCTDPATGLPKQVGGFPASFIDPQSGQNIGNDWDGNAQTGDNEPWYDVTRNQAARTGAFQRGKGRYMEDGPGGPGFAAAKPIRIGFTTLVVCIDEAKREIKPLGGFSWGFDVGNNGKSTLLGLGAANFGTAKTELNELFKTQFTQATDPKRWTVGDFDPDCGLKYEAVPEPFTMVLGAAALATAVGRRRRASGRNTNGG